VVLRGPSTDADRAASATLHVHALIDNLGAGGAELLLSEFAPCIRSAGVEFSVGYLHDRDPNAAARARLERVGIEPVLVPVTRLLKPADIQRVRQHVRRLAPDILHTHLEASDFLGGLASRRLGIPAVSTLHASTWRGGGPRERAKAHLVGRARRRFADVVIAVSAEARRQYLAEGWDRPERVVTVYNGITGGARPGAGAAVRRRWGLSPEHLVVGMLSTLRPEKGHDVAIGAAGRLHERLPQLRLVIMGEGPERARIAELVAPLGGVAVMAGHQEDVMAALDAVDVLLHPSRHDAFPTALLEAMAAAVPVVATRVGGIPEIVAEDRQGLLMEPPPREGRVIELVELLLRDPALRRRLGSEGQARVRREFSAQVWADHTRAVYDKLLAGARSQNVARR
jgi:glycosyltransferase involved in cell wall biosynthesis